MARARKQTGRRTHARPLRVGLPWSPPGDESIGTQTFYNSFIRALVGHPGVSASFFTDCGVLETERTAVLSEVGTSLSALGLGAATSVAPSVEIPDALGSRIDVFHNPLYEASTGFFDVIRARSLGPATTPVTWNVHALTHPYFGQNNVFPILFSGARPYDSCICPSRATQRALRNVFSTMKQALARDFATKNLDEPRVDWVPHGIDTEEFGRVDGRWARRVLKVPPDAFVLMFCGRLTPFDKADLLPLLESVARLRRKHPRERLVLLLAGKFPNEHVQELVWQHARTLGFDEHALLIRSLRAEMRSLLFGVADLFVSPADSNVETFGLSVLEALAAGVPQVVSDWSGYRDLVVHEQTGFLVPTSWAPCDQDHRPWAHIGSNAPGNLPWQRTGLLFGQTVGVDFGLFETAISTLVTNAALRRRFGEASRKRAATEFSWRRSLTSYAQLWAELRDIASVSASKPLAGRPWFVGDVGDVILENVSLALTDDATVALSALGQRVVAGRASLATYYEHAQAHPGVAAEAVLGVLMGRGRHTLKTVIDALEPSSGFSPAQLRRCVLWLGKYGVVSLKA